MTKEDAIVIALCAGVVFGAFILGVVAMRYHRGKQIGLSGAFLSVIGFLCVTAGLWSAIKIAVNDDGSFVIEVGQFVASSVEAQSKLSEANSALQSAAERAKRPAFSITCDRPWKGTNEKAVRQINLVANDSAKLLSEYQSVVSEWRHVSSVDEITVLKQRTKTLTLQIEELHKKIANVKVMASEPIMRPNCGGALSSDESVVNKLTVAETAAHSAIIELRRSIPNNQVNKDASR